MAVLQTAVEGAEPSRATSLTALWCKSVAQRSLTPTVLERSQARQPILWPCASTNKEQTPKMCSGRGNEAQIDEARINRLKQSLVTSAATEARIFMLNVLNKATVLVLNRNWQAINVRTP